MDNRCVCCGEIIPEGRQVCPNCERRMSMAYCKANQLDMHGFCNKFDCPCIKQNCRFFGVKTNADRIRAMSDEELANWLARIQMGAIKDAMDILQLPYDATDEIIELGTRESLLWLQQPAEGE